MIKLSESISQILNDSSKQFLLGNLQLKWEKIIGKTIASATEPIKIEKKKLYIKCKNSTWRNEINFQKNEIIKKINKNTNTNTNTINEIILI